MFHGPGPGRPKGSKNKATEEFKRMILERSKDGATFIETLFAWMVDPNKEEATHRYALATLLEYGFGKPKESVEVTGELTLRQLIQGSLRKVEDDDVKSISA
jgi:hypothetical protein